MSIFGNLEEFGAEPQQEKQTATPEKIVKADEYVLVTLSADYGDEFDVAHAWSMTKDDYDIGIKETEEYFKNKGDREIEIYFGTNEALYVRGFNDYMNNLSVENISKEDHEAFNRMFGGSFGMFDNYFPYGNY